MSDKAVSEKIKKLIAEGKPQDQAVAIALEMKRKGKLDSGMTKDTAMNRRRNRGYGGLE